ncbi:MAG TPA: metalloregulator ArsR/SmtB family transcription factor [Vineibacter sp.]|nr:metalloregulator ArsR/SmtB family transcription factor [Vineibacter sp.]
MRKPVARSQRLDLPEDRAMQLADLFRLLGDTSRLRIVAACLEQPTAVSAIADKLDLSLSLVSHHLRLLKAARVVRAERQGKNVFYAADDEHIRRVIVDMLEHVAEQRDED